MAEAVRRESVPGRGVAWGVALGLVCAASIFAEDWRWRVGLFALLGTATVSVWVLRRAGAWVTAFSVATLLLPPLPLALGDSGPQPALLFAALGLFSGLLRFREWRLRADGLTLPALALGAALLGSSAMALIAAGPAGAAGSLMRVGLFGIALYALLDLRHGPAGRDHDDPEPWLRAIFAAALAAAAFACLDFYFQWPTPAGFGEQFVWQTSVVLRRAQGLFYEAGQFGAFCSFFLTGTALLAFHPALRRRLGPTWLWPALALTLAAGLVFSFSRSAMLNALAALGAAAWLHRREVRRAAGIAVAGALVAAGVVYSVTPEFSMTYVARFKATLAGSLSDPAGVLGQRLESWRALLDFASSHPAWLAFGVGFKTLPYTDVAGLSITPDNMFLSLLIETGVAGLLATTWLLAALFTVSLRAARSPNETARFLGAWALCFWTGALVQMFWVDLLTFWRAMPLYLGVAALADRLADREEA